MKKINKVLSLVMVYLFAVALIPSSLTSTAANAQTKLPAYLTTQDGYLSTMYQYKDISIIRKQGNYEPLAYKIKNSKVEKYSDGYFMLYGQNQISQFGNIINIETGKVIYTPETIKTYINGILAKNSYSAKDLISKSFMQNKFGDAWERLCLNKNNKYETAYITDKGKLVKQTNSISGAQTINYNGLFQLGCSYNDKGQKSNTYLMNITSDGVIKNYPVKFGKSALNASSYVEQIFENNGTVFVRYMNWAKDYSSVTTGFDSFKIKNGALEFDRPIKQNKKGYVQVDQDIKGNLWTAENGYVSKLVNNTWVPVYQVNAKMTDVAVYDENHMIVAYSEYNSKTDKMTAKYTIINNVPKKTK